MFCWSKTTKRKIASGVAHIVSSFNNTIITITDINGNTIAQHSAAAEGYSGSRKSTAFAAEAAALALGNRVKKAVKDAQEITWQTLKNGLELGKKQIHPNRFFNFENNT